MESMVCGVRAAAHGVHCEGIQMLGCCVLQLHPVPQSDMGVMVGLGELSLGLSKRKDSMIL